MDVTTEAATGGSEQTSIAIIAVEGDGKLAQRQRSDLVNKPQ
jgi:hypothetical protein